LVLDGRFAQIVTVEEALAPNRYLVI